MRQFPRCATANEDLIREKGAADAHTTCTTSRRDPSMKTRFDVRALIKKEKSDWPQALVSYERGVREMRALDPPDTTPPTPPTNTSSWQYLAAVHGRPVSGTEDEEDHSDPLWTKCQHASWFFLPWHRMYLLT